MDLRDKDREYLLHACQMAEAARRPVEKLGKKPEPVWAALVATQARELASAVFVPGDKEDAVRKLLERFRPVDFSQEEVTLYLTLEPQASFERLPPVTESVKHLGVHRVVVGAEDPAPRFRGEGMRTLERMGFEVVLANGEVARRCQHLLDDYASVTQRGLAVLRARGELKKLSASEYDLVLAAPSPMDAVDAILSGLAESESFGSWNVILDPASTVKSASERSIVFQRHEVAPNARKLPYRDGQPDLGALLRDLASMGISSVELSRDPGIFREALKAGLLDSLFLRLPESSDTVQSLAQIAKVRFSMGGEDMELRLSEVRLKEDDSHSLVARVELC